ncbi:MAG: holo-ACP synthase [Gemmatimonadaceae bacterium]|nr:holo-ACP synthase [Gemmatimonadaceae bacterium]
MIVGIGIDLVDIARVQRLLSDRKDRAVRRLFTEAEVAYATARAEPARHFASRIAAKEATFKALTRHPRARAIGWREMEVICGDTGAPRLELSGLAASCAAELGANRWWISLTHSEGVAGAVVVVESTSVNGVHEGGDSR